MKPRSLIRSKLTLSATRRGRPVRGIRSHGTSVPRRRRSGLMQIPRTIDWARLHICMASRSVWLLDLLLHGRLTDRRGGELLLASRQGFTCEPKMPNDGLFVS
jgi:hypothetical protein